MSPLPVGPSARPSRAFARPRARCLPARAPEGRPRTSGRCTRRCI